MLLALAALLSACSSANASNIRYTDPEQQSLLELPSDWHLYEQDELAGVADLPFMGSVGNIDFPTRSVVAFDGAPSAAAANLTTDLASSPFPIGATSVRTIDTSTRDLISRLILARSVIDFTTYGEVADVSKEDFSFGKGFEGVRRLLALTTTDGQAQAVVYLISVTNPADDRLYSVAVGCSRDCFVENQEEIERVVDSWLVNTKG